MRYQYQTGQFLQYPIMSEDGLYHTLKGDDKFCLEVNRIVSEHWVNTGRALDLYDVMFGLLIKMFNEIYK